MTSDPQILKIYLAQLNPIVGDLKGNLKKALEAQKKAAKENCDLVVFPELFLTGYPPEDLMLRPSFQSAAMAALKQLAKETKKAPAIIIGSPYLEGDKLYNSAVLLSQGKIEAVRHKVKLPNYGVFDEKRIFDEGPMPGPINFNGFRIGLPICEDIWYQDVTECLQETGAEFFISPNSSPFSHNKRERRLSVATKRVVETGKPLIYVNAVGGQDELVFDGGSFVLDGARTLKCQLDDFKEDFAIVSLQKSDGQITIEKGALATLSEGLEATYKAAQLGLHDYIEKNKFKSVVLGLSGGIDSALVATLCVDALGKDRVHGVMLPYKYTSKDSLKDAEEIAANLGIRYDIIPIKDPVTEMNSALSDLFKGQKPDVTEENIQSRVRGVLLMAISNKFGAMLVTTGNKSEVSVGYATLYGDMNGGYNPIKDLYKTEVFALSRWRNQHCPKGLKGPKGTVIPDNIITKPPSAELAEGQRDDDSLPPYEILDEILRGLVDQEKSVSDLIKAGFEKETVKRVEHLLFLAEYKRRQSAPGVRLSEKNFGRDRRYPITNYFRDEV